jgi:uncharacterized membrane protein
MSCILLALISALGFSLFQVFYRYSKEEFDSFSSTFFVLLVNIILLGAIRLVTAGEVFLSAVPPVAVMHFALAGFIHFSVGWTLLNLSQKRLGAARTRALVGRISLRLRFPPARCNELNRKTPAGIPSVCAVRAGRPRAPWAHPL